MPQVINLNGKPDSNNNQDTNTYTTSTNIVHFSYKGISRFDETESMQTTVPIPSMIGISLFYYEITLVKEYVIYIISQN